MQAIRLRTEHMDDPMGIDIREPYLSWNCQGGITQTAYEIRAMKAGDEVWNSGKVDSGSMRARYGGSLVSRDRIAWQVRLWDEEGRQGEWSSEAFFEMGLLNPSDMVAHWINPELQPDKEKRQPAGVLRKAFTAKRGGAARAYITCHGLYEAYLNGNRIGNFVMAPGTGNYKEQLPYQTYDVTDLMNEGENEVRVILGDGWYRSAAGVEGVRNLFGEDIALLFQLEVDGAPVCVSDGTWEASSDGPIRECDMCQGEIYDARKEDIADWHDVKEEAFDKKNLSASNSVPIQEFERFEGKLISTPDGSSVVDFGQNLAGYVEFSVTAHAGDTIVLQHGEALDENGNFTIENFQPGDRHKEGGIFQKVTYICKEGRNTYKPHFSLFGFRYAKVETQADLSDAVFTSIAVYSKMEQLSSFTCGSAAVNQLVANSIWSQKGNFCDVPTDCPTRERAGWTGDAGVFVNTGLYLMDCYPVFRKWLGDCRQNQYADGKVRNINPVNNNESFFGGLLAGSAGWGDACIIVPYTMYKRNGDVRILEENYSMMSRWLGFLLSRANKGNLKGLFKKNPYKKFTVDSGIDYGEWCEPGVGTEGVEQNGKSGVATAYLAYSAGLLSEIARALGKEEDAQKYADVHENARKAYQFTQTNEGKIASKRQCDYVRPLAFGLLEEKDAVAAAKDLNELVIENGYHLNTGFLSTPFLCGMLTKYGYRDTAYRLLLQDTIPSWLYEVKQGATTIWENWDGISEDGKVKASLNHYSYGAICGFLMQDVCGIRYESDGLILAPIPDQSLGHARAEYLSPAGKIVSRWQYDGDKVRYEFEIPANVTAHVILTDGREADVTAGVHQM